MDFPPFLMETFETEDTMLNLSLKIYSFHAQEILYSDGV